MAIEAFAGVSARDGYATKARAVAKAKSECEKVEKVMSGTVANPHPLHFVVIVTDAGRYMPLVFLPEKYLYWADTLTRANVCVSRG